MAGAQSRRTMAGLCSHRRKSNWSMRSQYKELVHRVRGRPKSGLYVHRQEQLVYGIIRKKERLVSGVTQRRKTGSWGLYRKYKVWSMTSKEEDAPVYTDTPHLPV